MFAMGMGYLQKLFCLLLTLGTTFTSVFIKGAQA
jgi:hypothetical protein